MNTRSLVLPLVACAILTAGNAQAQHGPRPAVEVPRVGKMLDTQGVLRTVSGIAGNFLAGPSEAQGILALACSRQDCVTSTEAAVLATDGRHALEYSPQAGGFVRWNIGSRTLAPEPLAWSALLPGDEVLSLRLTPAGAEIAVRRSGSVWIVSQDGAGVDTLPSEATGPVLLLDQAVVYARPDAVVLQRSNGPAISCPVIGVLTLFSMSKDWVEAAAADALYAVRITPGREGLYALPGGEP